MMTKGAVSKAPVSRKLSQSGPPLIGHKPPFIFVHIPKTAGTSVRDAFKPYVQRPNPISRWYARKFPKPHVKGTLQAHSMAVQYRAKMGPAFDDHFVFTFVRNPFSWLVSFRSYVLSRPNHREHELVSSTSFEAWIDHRHKAVSAGKAPTQLAYLVDETGKSLVDFTGHVETISDDMEALNARLGTKAQIKHLNKTNHAPVASHFNAETTAMVVDAYRRDFDAFGYDTTPPDT